MTPPHQILTVAVKVSALADQMRRIALQPSTDEATLGAIAEGLESIRDELNSFEILTKLPNAPLAPIKPAIVKAPESLIGSGVNQEDAPVKVETPKVDNVTTPGTIK